MSINADTLTSNATEPRTEGVLNTAAAHAAIDGAADKAEQVLGRVKQGAHQGVDTLADTAAPHVQRLQDGIAAARDTGEEWAENLRTTVRENPLAAIAAAAALGMLVARLTR